MIPKKLGPYLVEEVLGRGGMGTVYRGGDPATGEQVALKVLAPDLASDMAFLQRFQEEVETLKELRHPNIVQLLSFGRQDDLFYFAMELVVGKSLYQMQKQGRRFSPAEAIKISLKICDGLHHSHNLGVVHRDLKPGNVIRADTGEIKLADYGIAKRFGGQQMTISGVLGTAEFMAPEQAQGKAASVPSDLYSLGAVIYSLISGRPPFEESTPQKTLEKVVSAIPPHLSHVAPGVPDELAQVVDKLLRKKPEDRFRSAKSVATKLSAILETLQEQAEMETNILAPANPPGTRNLSGGQSSGPPGLGKAASGQPTLADGLRENSNADAGHSQVTEKSSHRAAAAGSASGLGPGSAASPGSPPQSPSSATIRQTAAHAAGSARMVGGSPAGSSELGGSGATLRDSDSQTEGRSSQRVIREQDFFERAAVSSEAATEHEPSSFLVTILLACGFLVVVAASAFLVYDRVIRDRSADELWQVIQPATTKPLAVIPEMEKFLELYPDDPRALEVHQLARRAKAMQYRNALSLKAALNKAELKDIEKKFLQYTADDGESKFEKHRLLDSLVTFYSHNDENLDEASTKCLDAARVFRDQYGALSGDEIREQLQEISLRIEAANDIEAIDPERAAQLRRSLIDLFNGKTWADELILPLRQKMSSSGTE